MRESILLVFQLYVYYEKCCTNTKIVVPIMPSIILLYLGCLLGILKSLDIDFHSLKITTLKIQAGI